MRIVDRLTRLDSRVFKNLRPPGEAAAAYLRRVAAHRGIAIRNAAPCDRRLAGAGATYGAGTDSC